MKKSLLAVILALCLLFALALPALAEDVIEQPLVEEELVEEEKEEFPPIFPPMFDEHGDIAFIGLKGYKTLADAVFNAKDNDTIVVKAKVESEALYTDVDKIVTIKRDFYLPADSVSFHADKGYWIYELESTKDSITIKIGAYKNGNPYEDWRYPQPGYPIPAYPGPWGTNEQPGCPATPCSRLPFTDVCYGDRYYDDIAFLYEKAIMYGVSDTMFAADGEISRGMIVTMLWRMEGCPIVTGAYFTDVAAKDYYYNAVTWAAKNGIAYGYGNGEFKPSQAVTQEELIAFIHRYAELKKVAYKPACAPGCCADVRYLSPYAAPAVCWAYDAGVTPYVCCPNTFATRGECAYMLHMLYSLI